jgi:hypothetical protein
MRGPISESTVGHLPRGSASPTLASTTRRMESSRCLPSSRGRLPRPRRARGPPRGAACGHPGGTAGGGSLPFAELQLLSSGSRCARGHEEWPIFFSGKMEIVRAARTLAVGLSLVALAYASGTHEEGGRDGEPAVSATGRTVHEIPREYQPADAPYGQWAKQAEAAGTKVKAPTTPPPPPVTRADVKKYRTGREGDEIGMKIGTKELHAKNKLAKVLPRTTPTAWCAALWHL